MVNSILRFAYKKFEVLKPSKFDGTYNKGFNAALSNLELNMMEERTNIFTGRGRH